MFRYTKATAAREVIVWIITLAMLLPFYILIVTSLKSDQEALTTSAVAPPTSIDFSAFVEVLTTTGRNSIPMSILNSVIITAGAIFGLVLFGSVAAYVIARRTRRWTTWTYYLVLIAIILPAQLGTVPLYIGARSVGLTGNAIGMILLWIGILLPLSVFLYASFFRGLSTEAAWSRQSRDHGPHRDGLVEALLDPRARPGIRMPRQRERFGEGAIDEAGPVLDGNGCRHRGGRQGVHGCVVGDREDDPVGCEACCIRSSPAGCVLVQPGHRRQRREGPSDVASAVDQHLGPDDLLHRIRRLHPWPAGGAPP